MGLVVVVALPAAPLGWDLGRSLVGGDPASLLRQEVSGVRQELSGLRQEAEPLRGALERARPPGKL
jgi:hypothetical protein